MVACRYRSVRGVRCVSSFSFFFIAEAMSHLRPTCSALSRRALSGFSTRHRRRQHARHSSPSPARTPPRSLWRSSMHILLSSVHSPYTIRWCLAIGQTAGACVCPTQSHLSDVNTLASPEAHIYMRIYPTPTRAPDPLCPYSTQSARTVRRAPAHPGAHMHVYAHTFTPHTCPRYVNLGGIFSC